MPNVSLYVSDCNASYLAAPLQAEKMVTSSCCLINISSISAPAESCTPLSLAPWWTVAIITSSMVACRHYHQLHGGLSPLSPAPWWPVAIITSTMVACRHYHQLHGGLSQLSPAPWWPVAIITSFMVACRHYHQLHDGLSSLSPAPWWPVSQAMG